MKKNDVFTFTAPNGVEVTAVVVHVYETRNEWYSVIQSDYLCYAQNRLFIGNYYDENGTFCNKFTQHDIVVDYAILPDYDEMLERYYDLEVAQTENMNGM